MRPTVININEYLRTIKQEVEKLEDVHQVKLMGTSFTAEDIDKLSHQDGYANALITSVGGGVESKGQQEWNTCTVGIYILCGKDNDPETIGYSSTAIDVAHQALQLVHKNAFGKQHSGALSIPKIKVFSAFTNEDFEKRGFVAWYCVFTQQLRIA